MTTHIALLRGINIGPKKRIKMEPLRELVTGLGHTNVRTYVNSGNVVFDVAGNQSPPDLAASIENALRTQHELDVALVIRTGQEMAGIVKANPFLEIAATPKLLHVSFLAQPLTPEQQDRLDAIETGDDRFRLDGPNVYLHLPNGMAGSTPALTGFDRALKIVATSRNWNTVLTLASMAEGSSDS